MPTFLPPRRPQTTTENSDFSPLLSIVAALLALLVVFAEAQAMGIVAWPNYQTWEAGLSPEP